MSLVKVTVDSFEVKKEDAHPFCAYELTVTEGGKSHTLSRRWNDLKLMYEELQKEHKAELHAARDRVPKFEPHSWRLGGSHLDPDFLKQRQSRMEELLQALLDAFDISLAAESGPECVRTFLAANGRPSARRTVNALPKELAAELDAVADDDDAAAAAAAAAAAKKKKKLKIRKGGTVEGGGKHTTFDDDGVALQDRLAGGFADVAAEKAESEGADGRDGRIASVRSLLQQTAADDRARERERVRSKHQLQKKRWREAEEAADGGGGGGGSEMVLEAAEDDGTAALLADDSDGEYDGPRGPAPPRRAGGEEQGKKKRKSREAEAAALLDSLLGK